MGLCIMEKFNRTEVELLDLIELNNLSKCWLVAELGPEPIFA